MASSVDFDPSGLVAPIPGDHPTGVDLRADPARNGAFRAVREAREEARRAERKADLDGEPLTQALPFWRTVRDVGQKLLAEESKDLEIVAYVIEALVRTDGFAGLKLGFRTARELIENFWDGLYPAPDEDGIATRVLPLARLNGDDAEGLLIASIQRIPITQEKSVGPFACWHYRQATELAGYSDREREERIKRGAVTPEQFAQAVAESDTPFLQQLAADIAQCQREFEALCEALDGKCGRAESPPSSSIREALENCLLTLRSVAKDRLELPAQESEEGASGGAPSPGRLANREVALQTLLGVAEFFERTEPLSLLGAQIRKLVRLGRMSPAEYYSELIEDRGVRDQLFKLVGIKPPPTDESS